MRVGGPADVTIDGEIDEMDLQFFFQDMYDWNEDGYTDDTDLSDFFTEWSSPSTLGVAFEPLWTDFDNTYCR